MQNASCTKRFYTIWKPSLKYGTYSGKILFFATRHYSSDYAILTPSVKPAPSDNIFVVNCKSWRDVYRIFQDFTKKKLLGRRVFHNLSRTTLLLFSLRQDSVSRRGLRVISPILRNFGFCCWRHTRVFLWFLFRGVTFKRVEWSCFAVVFELGRRVFSLC
jgi:hypothetical protein